MMALARQPGPGAIPEIEITRFRRWHVRKVLNIERRVYPRPWTGTLFFSELAQKNTRSYVVARHEGEVVGYAGMMLTGLEAHITNIAVEPEMHGLKIGTRLLVRMITEAIARGVKEVSLEVRVSNHKARMMYEKFGFEVEGTRRGYYVETNEDAFVMVVPGIDSTDYRHRLEEIRAQFSTFGGPSDV
jgi:[ribosomal protein S18]-alanine N-acetyltransferase